MLFFCFIWFQHIPYYQNLHFDKFSGSLLQIPLLQFEEKLFENLFRKNIFPGFCIFSFTVNMYEESFNAFNYL